MVEFTYCFGVARSRSQENQLGTVQHYSTWRKEQRENVNTKGCGRHLLVASHPQVSLQYCIYYICISDRMVGLHLPVRSERLEYTHRRTSASAAIPNISGHFGDFCSKRKLGISQTDALFWKET
ncbi:hypothetical protein J6590_021124 [Homalodisca vitripennis]|nr:hypothetical protein J6590_021124 [Homalodisca vitripennis]